MHPTTSVVGCMPTGLNDATLYTCNSYLRFCYPTSLAHERWTTRNKAVDTPGYHLIWCTNDRRTVLVDRAADRLNALLTEKAATRGLTIEGMDVMPDHFRGRALRVAAAVVHVAGWALWATAGVAGRRWRAVLSSFDGQALWVAAALANVRLFRGALPLSLPETACDCGYRACGSGGSNGWLQGWPGCVRQWCSAGRER